MRHFVNFIYTWLETYFTERKFTKRDKELFEIAHAAQEKADYPGCKAGLFHCRSQTCDCNETVYSPQFVSAMVKRLRAQDAEVYKPVQETQEVVLSLSTIKEMQANFIKEVEDAYTSIPQVFTPAIFVLRDGLVIAYDDVIEEFIYACGKKDKKALTEVAEKVLAVEECREVLLASLRGLADVDFQLATYLKPERVN